MSRHLFACSLRHKSIDHLLTHTPTLKKQDKNDEKNGTTTEQEVKCQNNFKTSATLP